MAAIHQTFKDIYRQLHEISMKSDYTAPSTTTGQHTTSTYDFIARYPLTELLLV